MIVPMAPLSKSIRPATCVGTSTTTRVAVLGLAGDQPLGERHAGRAGDAADRADQVDQRRQVVRPHVEHRAAADVVIELRIGVPALVAVTRHERRGRDRFADHAVVNQLAARLDAAAEKRVRGATEQQPVVARRGKGALTIGALHGQRLFDVDVLPGFQRHQVDLGVRLGDRQVDDDLNLRVVQQFVNRAGLRHAELGGARLRPRHVNIGARDHVQDGECAASLEIGRADVAAPDDSDFHGITHNLISFTTDSI